MTTETYEPPPFAITSTARAGRKHLNLCVHGPSGAGKTYLARTTGDLAATFVISAEKGLLSLRDVDIAAVEVQRLDALQQVYQWLRGGRHPYRWIILDSLSEIAETVLTSEKEGNKDGRKAYGEMQDRVKALVKAFRDLPLNVVFICQQARVQDDTGRILFGPRLPGKQLAQVLPYLLDEVLCLHVGRDGEGNVERWLQTQPSQTHEAKDRSGALDQTEPPDLSHIAEKILGTTAPAGVQE